MVLLRWRLALCIVVLWEFAGSVSGECSEPPPRDPGILEQEFAGRTQFPEGTVIRYTCRIGYHMATGNGQSTCIPSGAGDGGFTWTAPSMACSPVSCAEPERLPNGNVIGTEYSFGKTVQFKCNPGYLMYTSDNHGVLEGEEPERECMADGAWSGTTPICKPVQCPPPGRSITDGTVEVSSIDYMGIITYSCNPGLQIKGSIERRCLPTGTWSGKEPVCVDIQCPEPEDREFKAKYPLVAAHLTLSVEPGHTAHFECTNNKSINRTSTCTNTGKMGEWIPAPPECVTTPVPTGPDEGTTVEPDTETSADPASSEVDHTEPPSTNDPSAGEGLPIWAVALLVVLPVSCVLGVVVAFLWKRSKHQHHRIPTKDEKNGAVDLPVMSTNAQQV